MMKQYIADAFTDRLFAGNPAAVLPCRQMPPASLMQAIAIENNYSDRYADRVYITGQAVLFMPGEIPFDL